MTHNSITMCSLPASTVQVQSEIVSNLQKTGYNRTGLQFFQQAKSMKQYECCDMHLAHSEWMVSSGADSCCEQYADSSCEPGVESQVVSKV